MRVVEVVTSATDVVVAKALEVVVEKVGAVPRRAVSPLKVELPQMMVVVRVHGAIRPSFCNSGHCRRIPPSFLRWMNSLVVTICGLFSLCQCQSRLDGRE